MAATRSRRSISTPTAARCSAHTAQSPGVRKAEMEAMPVRQHRLAARQTPIGRRRRVSFNMPAQRCVQRQFRSQRTAAVLRARERRHAFASIRRDKRGPKRRCPDSTRKRKRRKGRFRSYLPPCVGKTGHDRSKPVSRGCAANAKPKTGGAQSKGTGRPAASRPRRDKEKSCEEAERARPFLRGTRKPYLRMVGMAMSGLPSRGARKIAREVRHDKGRLSPHP